MRNILSSSPRLTAIVLSAVAVCLYANALGNGFVFDDHDQVVDNPWIRDFGHVGQIFATHIWAFAGKPSSYYRPLLFVAYAVVHAAFGPSPVAFHAFSVLVHVGVTLLVFVLLRRLVLDGACAFLGAMVFAAHPVHAETVAWISALPDLGCAGFTVLAIVAFIASWKHRNAATLLHVGGAVSFLAAVLFKEPGAALPGVIALLDLARRPKACGATYWWSRYGSLVVAGVIYRALRLYALGAAMPYEAQTHATTMDAIHLAGTALWRYVAMLIVPYPLNAFQTLDSAVPLP